MIWCMKIHSLGRNCGHVAQSKQFLPFCIHANLIQPQLLKQWASRGEFYMRSQMEKRKKILRGTTKGRVQELPKANHFIKYWTWWHKITLHHTFLFLNPIRNVMEIEKKTLISAFREYFPFTSPGFIWYRRGLFQKLRALCPWRLL